MFIYNTTFQTNINDAQNLVIYLHEKYIPEDEKYVEESIISNDECTNEPNFIASRQ